MKNLFLLITVTLFSSYITAQNDTIPKKYLGGHADFVNKMSFKIGIGALIPKEGLKEYFGTSPMLDLTVNFPLKNKKSIDLTFQFAVPNQKDDFAYLRTIDTIQAKSTFMFNGFLKFKKDIVHSNNIELNVGLGVGLSYVTTNARNPFYESKDEDDSKYEKITALLVSPGFEFIKRFKNSDELTLGIGIQYSPYKVEGAIREDIGGLFYVPKLAYKF